MSEAFIIEVLVKPKTNQPTPTEDELDELEEILNQIVDSYLKSLAEELDERGEEDGDV